MVAIAIVPNTTQKKVFYSTISKLEKSQQLKEKLIPYLEENYPYLLRNPIRKVRIRECCNMVTFRRYLETGDVQLVSSNFCKYDRICIACATKRAMRMIKKFSQGIQNHSLWNKKRYYIVLTISHKQGDKLSDLMDRLMSYKDILARSYRNGKRDKQKHKSFFSQFDGMVMSIEIAHKGKNGWHPHINILACTDSDIFIEKGKYLRGETNPELLEEWKKATQGSYIHNIRRIEVSKGYFSRSGIGEVFKYAIKFSDLTVQQLAEVMAIQHSRQYHFFATYGIFRGWKLGKGLKFVGDWSEGIFLYDKNQKSYVKSMCPLPLSSLVTDRFPIDI